MLFYLTDSLLVDKSSSDYLGIITAISNIAIAVYESKHSINGDITIMDSMSKNEDLDFRSRMVLNNVVQQYSIQPIPQQITYYIEVTNGVAEPSLRKVGNRKVAQISYNEFLDTKSTQECCLIGEYYYDCEFFQLILNWYKRLLGISLSTNLENIDGGGDDTLKKVKQFVGRNKRPTICIVDSDKKYPEQEIATNSTCGKCMNLYPDRFIYRFIALNVQETENLVPLSVIDNLSWVGKAKPHKDSFDHLRNSPECMDILPFFDIKKGIQYHKSLFQDSMYLTYVKKCCSCNPNIPDGKEFDDLLKHSSEKDVIYPSLLKDLLKDSLEYISTNKIETFDLLEFQEKEWKNIAQNMLNWGFCRNAESVS